MNREGAKDAKEKENNGLPRRWSWTKLGEVCHPPQYGWTTSASGKGKLHLLRTTDITSGRVVWESVPFCSDEPSDKEKYLLKDGDVVISRAGSVGYSLLLKNPKSAVFASYLIRFKPLIDEEYVAYFLQSPSYWQSISTEKLGIAIPNVNASKLKQIPFPLAPLPEQRRIVAEIETRFTRLDAGIAALKRVRTNLKRYKATVLKAACEGKLVSQDPSDEPAEKLLERILTERRAKWEFASYLIRLRFDPNAILSRYVVSCINSEIGRRHVVKVKHQVAGQANINSQDIRAMPISLPPLAEQHRIVAEVERRLSVAQELEATVAANLARAERLRQAILAQAFSGKLVPQDPNDEPASLLLERIQEGKKSRQSGEDDQVH